MMQLRSCWTLTGKDVYVKVLIEGLDLTDKGECDGDRIG